MNNKRRKNVIERNQKINMLLDFCPNKTLKRRWVEGGGEVEGRACDFFLKVSPSVTRRPFSSMGFIKVHRARSGEKGKQKSEQNITKVK